MNKFRPKVKTYLHPDHDGPEMMRRLDIHSQTPWTTTSGSWRAASAPLLWPRDPSKNENSGGSGSEDPFAPELAALDGLKMSTNVINKFYIPISKLPPLGGPDPRRHISKKAPNCAPDFSVSRADILINRWRSIESLPGQLPSHSLQMIQAETKRHIRQSKKDQSHDRLLQPNLPQRHGSARRVPQEGQPPLSRRENTDHRLARAFEEAERGSARGKKEHPHIPCACCDHKVDKPWMQSRKPEPRVVKAAHAQACAGANSAEPPSSDGGGQYAEPPGRHSVSWEEDEQLEAESMESSECWSEAG